MKTRPARTAILERFAQHDARTIDWTGCPFVEIVPGRVSGAPVMVGSRIPVEAILVNRIAHPSPEEVAAMFPPLTAEMVAGVFHHCDAQVGRRRPA